jgi:hypothetical protein
MWRALTFSLGFCLAIHLQLPANTHARNLRVVAFVQQENQGRILGATMQPVP